MTINSVTATVIAVVFISSLVRTVFGFGNALVAMPLLALAGLGMKTATPLVALVSFVLGIAILLQSWKNIDMKSTWRLLAATALGIPIGTMIVKSAFEDIGEIALALLIIAYSAYSLSKPRLIKLENDWFAFPFGFAAGVLGGAYNSNGPPVVIYGALRRWNPEELRATLQGYFLPSSVIIVAGHGIGGLWNAQIFNYFLFSLPAAALAIVIGRRLHRHIPPGHFDRLINVALLCIGLLLLYQTVFSS
jgi:uncharacterized membrane protein YfcA